MFVLETLNAARDFEQMRTRIELYTIGGLRETEPTIMVCPLKWEKGRGGEGTYRD